MRLMRSAAHHRDPERGAALVEFALICPILFALLVGTISVASVYDRQLALTGAAREGARYGATVAPDQIFTSGSWAANVRQVVIDRATGSLDSTSAAVCVSLVRGSPAVTYQIPSGTVRLPTWYSTKSSGAPCLPTETYPITSRDDGLRIQVTVSTPGQIQAILVSRTITISADATVQSESAA